MRKTMEISNRKLHLIMRDDSIPWLIIVLIVDSSKLEHRIMCPISKRAI